MNIDGFGEKRVEAFLNNGLISSFEDIYKLHNRKDEILQMEKFGEKSFDNLIEAIENSKNNSLERLINGLGIRQVGEKASKIREKTDFRYFLFFHTKNVGDYAKCEKFLGFFLR